MSQIAVKGKVMLAGFYYCAIKVAPPAEFPQMNQTITITAPESPADWVEGQEVEITIRSVEK